MTPAKNLGIWMDHSRAHLMDLTDNNIEVSTITSNFSREDKEESLSKSENLMHNKEKQHSTEYYKKIEKKIIYYNHVLLFGPTEAKVELFNVIRTDNRFANIKIEIRQADKMTENQQHAYVKEYFQFSKNTKNN